MAGKKDKSDGRQLTELQRRFALQVLEGKSPSLVHAYREVYDCKGDSPKQKKAQANEASRLWKHPGVRSSLKSSERKLKHSECEGKWVNASECGSGCGVKPTQPTEQATD